MKRLSAVCALALLPIVSSAADRTLFGEDDTWNLFTTVEVKFSELGQDDAFLGGVQFGGILNDQFAVGLAGYALLQEADVGVNDYDNPQEFDLVYGGLILDYTLYADALLHGSFSVFVGGGQVRLDELDGGDDKDISLFVIEPTLNLMVNVTQRSELGLGIGYRHTDGYGSEVEGLESGDLSSLAGTLFVRFTEL